MSHAELVETVAERECKSSDLRGIPLLVAFWSPWDTVYATVSTLPGDTLTDSTCFQLGTLTAAFLAADLEDSLSRRGATLQTAIDLGVDGPDRTPPPLTYADLLTHRTGLTPYDPGPPYPTDDELIVELTARIPASPRANAYRYDVLNYALAWYSLRRALGRPRLRPGGLAYSDRVRKEDIASLAPSAARLPSPAVQRRSDLLAAATAGITDARGIIDLIWRLDRRDLGSWPSASVESMGGTAEAVPGWHRFAVGRDRWVYLAAGRTRRHGASVAYDPTSRRAVVVLAAGSRQVGCLSYRLLRQRTDGWREVAPGTQSAAQPRGAP